MSLYKSTDGGKTLYQFDKGVRKNEECECGINGFTVSNAHKQFLITCDGDVYRRDDTQPVWIRLSNVPSSPNYYGCKNDAQEIFSADRVGKHLFATSHVGFFESLDGGVTWDLSLNAIVSSTTDPKVQPFFIATTKGVYRRVR